MFELASGIAGQSQGLAMASGGLDGVGGTERVFAEVVEGLGLAKPAAKFIELLQSLLVADGGGGVIAGELLDQAKLI